MEFSPGGPGTIDIRQIVGKPFILKRSPAESTVRAQLNLRSNFKSAPIGKEYSDSEMVSVAPQRQGHTQ